jgi:plastocyanin
MVMRTHLIALTAAGVLLLGACSPAEDDPGAGGEEAGPAPAETTEAGTTEAEPATVEIVDFSFQPETLEVPAGTTVEWVQLDSSRHTVDFEDGERSGDLAEGATYQRTFEEPGEHPYVCFFHPRMTATVVVTG